MAKLYGTTELRLFNKDKLLEDYEDATKTCMEELRVMVKKTLVPFVSVSIITEGEKRDWTKKDYENETEERFKSLICKVQDSRSLDVYIRFSKALTFRNSLAELKGVYHFAPDLFEVGLHDPLQGKEEVQLVPRSSKSSSRPTVLWLVTDRLMFDMCSAVLEGGDRGHESGYEVLKSSSDFLNVHLAYSEDKPKAPGRKYNSLLARYNPCPSLLLCTTECVLGDEEDSADTERVFLVSSFSQSEYDMTVEASHVTQLCCLLGKISYLSKVEVCMREATRYLGVPGRSVHCPDAATLHYASKKSNIPAVAIARVRMDINNATDGFYKYVFELIKRMV